MNTCMHIFMWTTCVLGDLGDQKKKNESFGTEFTEFCELICGYQELNFSPLQKQPVLFSCKPLLYPLEAQFLFLAQFPVLLSMNSLNISTNAH